MMMNSLLSINFNRMSTNINLPDIELQEDIKNN